MQLLESLTRLISRFRYPVSLPEDVARDLGMDLPNTLSFHDFIQLLSSPHHRPAHLRKFMPRRQAEETFVSALKKENFKSCSLFSYSFNKSWLVIALYFDNEERLRRLHLQCPACQQLDGFDILLEEEIYAAASSH
ncbi:MAG: hypothetical protein S4CHLAM2_06110 [Chlamydiales bacterium]|nr:hypothetical protein [Chlamydiales bacterium]